MLQSGLLLKPFRFLEIRFRHKFVLKKKFAALRVDMLNCTQIAHLEKRTYVYKCE